MVVCEFTVSFGAGLNVKVECAPPAVIQAPLATIGGFLERELDPQLIPHAACVGTVSCMSGANHLTVHAPMLRSGHRPDATDPTARSALRPGAVTDKFVCQ